MFNKNEPILTINVKCNAPICINGHTRDIVMITFSGTAEGACFSGKVIGTGVDTQKISKNGDAFLSARYILEGVDYKNNPCRIFIENEGSDATNCTPLIVTDSDALAELEGMKLRSVVEAAKDGVTVKIFQK